MMLEFFWRSLLIGIGGTAAMDIWALFLKVAFGMALPNWAMVGRWFAHVGNGTIFHEDIGKSPPVANELWLGWFFHYATGIFYACILVWLAGPAWVQTPTFLPALINGLVTVGAGWFILQPGMGAGWAASKRQNPWKIRALNIATHVVFAAGLYAAAMLTA